MGSSITTLQSNISSLNSTLSGQINSAVTTLNGEIDDIKSDIETINDSISDLQARTFVSSSLSVGTGTTDLSSYLPDDDNQYLVFLYCNTSSYGTTVSVSSDICSTINIAHTDHDSGRATSAAGEGVLPIGSGRTISCSGSSVQLRGYMRI